MRSMMTSQRIDPRHVLGRYCKVPSMIIGFEAIDLSLLTKCSKSVLSLMQGGWV